ncbi:hypothetical protein M3Y94_00582700 [Aphelenchoides besseyi]|nr:hypothetical protein M3Y94_00582700 [Aphelenchoides besseyi]KAI6222046.1 CBFD-NFYB-HMF domain-containing protein [Aphelenchoides besseyi]
MSTTQDETITIDDANESAEPSAISSGSIPLARVKKILKLCSGVTNISADSVKLIQLFGEEYLRALVKATQQNAAEAGRKTLQMKDLNRAIQDDWAFSLLEDTLVEWPEIGSKSGKENTNSQVMDIEDM